VVVPGWEGTEEVEVGFVLPWSAILSLSRGEEVRSLMKSQEGVRETGEGVRNWGRASAACVDVIRASKGLLEFSNGCRG
jgi:hypothetical protein